MKHKYVGLKAAACTVVVLAGGFTAALNTSQTFAAAVEDIPVLNSIAKVITFREYHYQDEEKEVTVEVPSVVQKEEMGEIKETENTETTEGVEYTEDAQSVPTSDYLDTINAKIQETVDAYVASAEQQIAEYKEAFLATGGTEDEFTAKNIKVDVSYDVKCETADMVSLVLTANENWCGAYNMNYYYNLNVKDGTDITLKDLLGEDYVSITNEQIQKEMQKREEEDDNITYFTVDEGGFQSVDDATTFYINEAGNPVIVFAKYEVAPGFMGVQEFEITIK